MSTTQQSLTDKIASLQLELQTLLNQQASPIAAPAPVTEMPAPVESNTSVGEAVSGIAGLAGPYGILIDLGFAGVKAAIGAFTKAKAPQDVLDALQAAEQAIMAHQEDLITKANLEAQRA